MSGPVQTQYSIGEVPGSRDVATACVPFVQKG